MCIIELGGVNYSQTRGADKVAHSQISPRPEGKNYQIVCKNSWLNWGNFEPALKVSMQIVQVVISVWYVLVKD